MSIKQFVSLCQDAIENVSSTKARDIYQSIQNNKNKKWFTIYDAQYALYKKIELDEQLELLQDHKQYHAVDKLLNKKPILQLLNDLNEEFCPHNTALISLIPALTYHPLNTPLAGTNTHSNDSHCAIDTLYPSITFKECKHIMFCNQLSDDNENMNIPLKNKWRSHNIRKMISFKRKLGKYYRKKQNKTWKHKVDKRRRSKQCKLTLSARILTNEILNHADYTHYTKSQHIQFIKEQEKLYTAIRNKYCFTSNGHRQTKKRKTRNVSKGYLSHYSTQKPQKTQNEAVFNESILCAKQVLKVECRIMFTHSDNDKTTQHSMYKLMKVQILIFDKYKRSYWTAFELIPCIKEVNYKYPQNKLFSVRNDLDIKINNKTDKTDDDNYSFYYIAQYCYEIRTPYIEYELKINNSLKKPLWKLSAQHKDNDYHNKFIINYDLKDVLRKHLFYDDIMNVLCGYIGYKSIGITVMDGLCEYNIDDRCNYIRHELALMKKYTPPYVRYNNIVDENGELLQCKKVKRRLRIRKSNGIENWHFEQWNNIPCSMHGAIWRTQYINQENGGVCSTRQRAKYENNKCYGDSKFGTRWWVF